MCVVCWVGFSPRSRRSTWTALCEERDLGDSLVLLALRVQETDERGGWSGEQRKELSADTVEGRQLGKDFDFSLGEDLGVEDASLHFELREIFEEGDEHLGNTCRIFATRDQCGVTREVLAEIGQVSLLGGDAQDAILDDVVLGAMGTELITDGRRIFNRDASKIGNQKVIRGRQLGGYFVDEELFFSAHVRVLSVRVGGLGNNLSRIRLEVDVDARTHRGAKGERFDEATARKAGRLGLHEGGESDGGVFR